MRNVLCLLIIFSFLFLAGCGSTDGPRIVYGRVTVGNDIPDTGEVRFMPVEGTRGSVNVALIVNGEYRIEGRGGVPLGNYRIEIIAKQKTGKQVRQYNGFEMAMVEEEIPISPPVYAGSNSPLTQEVTSTSGNKVDFDLPAE
ncbi:MAG: hypothetical protein ABGX16_21910 [Pirellulales bacterium]